MFACSKIKLSLKDVVQISWREFRKVVRVEKRKYAGFLNLNGIIGFLNFLYLKKAPKKCNKQNENKAKYAMELGIYFLMEIDKWRITIKSNENSLIRTYFLHYPVISRCEI